MPEDPIINEGQNQITYNVVLDPGDISRQAEEIRNQLDLALGVGSNAGTQFINTTDVINPQFTPMPMGDMSSVPGQFSGTMDETFWQKAQASLGEAYQNMSQGVDMVRNDLSRMVDRTTNVIQQYQPTPQPVNPYEELLPDSFGEYLVGSLGFGGDIKGPVSLGKYEAYSERKLREGFEDVLQNPGEALASVTDAWAGAGPLGTASYIGAHFIPGFGAALSIAEGVGLADEWLSGAYNKREDLAGGIQEIARQTFGNISKDEARGISQNVLDFVNSYEGYAKDYNIEEVASNITQFANEGGFSNVQNADELQSKMQAVTEQTRQIARNLGVFQEEAVSIMAELEQRSMVNVESMRDMSEKMKFYSGVLREAPTELLQGAVNTAEQFRQAGSFISPETAMNTYIDANVEAQNLIRSSDPFIQSSVYRMGGKEGVAQGLINSYGQFQNSTMGGYINMSNAAGGSGANINDMFTNIGGAYQDLNSITMYQARGKELATQNQSFDELALNFVDLATSLYQQLSPNENPSFENIEGLLMLPGMNQMFGNLSQDQVRMMVQSVRNQMIAKQNGVDPNKRMEQGRVVSALDSAIENTETTKLGELEANTIRYVDELGRELSYTYGGLKGIAVENLTNALFSTKVIENTSDNESIRWGETGDVTEVTANFTNQFVREQVGAGYNSNVMKLAEEEYRNKKEERAIELLGYKGIKITDRKELQKKEYQDILKNYEVADKVDEETIKNNIALMRGEDLSLTEDQRFALKMWDKDPVDAAFREEQYYTDSINNLLREDPTIFKDKSLEEVMNIIDARIPTPNAQMPENIRKQVQWQAMDNVKDKDFKEKMIDKEEAKKIGEGSWQKLGLGQEMRKVAFQDAKIKYDKEIAGTKKYLELEAFYDPNIANLGVKGTTAYDDAFTKALDLVTSEDWQGSSKDAEIFLMSKTEELYDKSMGEGAFEKAGLNKTLQHVLYSGESGGEYQKFIKNISDRSTLKPLQQVFSAVDQRIAELKAADEKGLLTFNAEDITEAFNAIMPSTVAAGAPIKYGDITGEAVAEMDKLIKQVKADTSKDPGAYNTQIETLMSKMTITPGQEQDVKKAIQDALHLQQTDQDTKDVGVNTKHMKNYLWSIDNSLRKQVDRPYKEWDDTRKVWVEKR